MLDVGSFGFCLVSNSVGVVVSYKVLRSSTLFLEECAHLSLLPSYFFVLIAALQAFEYIFYKRGGGGAVILLICVRFCLQSFRSC